MPTPYSTGVVRIIWGSAEKHRPKIDQATKRPIIKPNGQPAMQLAFGIGIPKAEYPPLWDVMKFEATKLFPTGQFPRDFAWKIIDGDNGMDKNNKPYRDREGYAGHMVLAVSSELDTAPGIQVLNAQGTGFDVFPPGLLKAGHYVRVSLTIDGHMGASPGLYINPNLIQFIGYGPEIVNGPDAVEAFGLGRVALPPGASATPVGPSGGPGMPAAAPAPVPPGYPQPAPAGAPAPVPYAAPTYQPPNPAAPPAPAPTAYPSNPAPAPAPDFTRAAMPPGYPAPAPAAPAYVPPVPVQPAPPPPGYTPTFRGFGPDGVTPIWL